MKQIIETDPEKCRGCGNCVGVCPVKGANVIHNEKGRNVLRIDPKQCIACGACLPVCPEGIRFYNDDSGRFFGDLKNGEAAAVIVAPAFMDNFLNWGGILSWLKAQGARVVVDVSLGINICTWAHIRHMEKQHKTLLITQPCPPITAYIQKHCPKIKSCVSPVRSPILCTAIYLKTVLKLPLKIAALTPCPAKANEFDNTKTISYNVTFKKLWEYISLNSYSVEQEDFTFDDIAGFPGEAFRVNSSLPDSINCCAGPSIKLRTSGGPGAYRSLDSLKDVKTEKLPVLFDALNCTGGCSCGIGCYCGDYQPYPTKPEQQKGLTEYDMSSAKHFPAFDIKLRLADYLE